MRLQNLEQSRLPSFSISILLGVLDEARIDSCSFLKSCGVSESALEDPGFLVSGTQELLAQRSFVGLTMWHQDLWAEAGKRYRLLTNGPIGLALMTSPSLGDVIRVQESYLDHTYTFTRFHLVHDREDEIGLWLDFADVPDDLKAFVRCRDTVGMTVFLNDLWNGHFPLKRIELEGASPLTANALKVDAEIVEQSARTVFYWSESLMAEPLPNRNALLHKAYCRSAEILSGLSASGENLFIETVDRVMGNSAVNEWTLPRLATALGISTRSLQRRLAERDLSFRKLLAERRLLAAKSMLLETTRSVSEVAWQCGYANPSGLTHAFRRSLGLTPGAYRRSAGRYV